MKKTFRFLPLLIFSWSFFQTGWGQFLNTLYTHREIDFFTEEEELEGYDEAQYRLIPHTDIYINFNTGIGFIAEKDNFNQIEDLANAAKDAANPSRPNTNQLGYFRKNNVKPYQIGLNMDVFIFDYFGIGFTYTRNHYFSHLSSISPPNSSTNYYNETIGYEVNAIGNNFQFSVMGRYSLGKRYDYNIFLIGGLGYNLATLDMSFHYDNKIDGENREQEYSSLSHSFHVFTELIFKVKHFNFGFGLLLQTITFNDYELPNNSEFTPQQYDAVKLGPTLYFKIGFNI